MLFFIHPCVPIPPVVGDERSTRIADNIFEEEGREKYSRLALSSGPAIANNKAERVGGNVAAYRWALLSLVTRTTLQIIERGRRGRGGTNNGAEQCIYFNNRTIRRGRLSVTLRNAPQAVHPLSRSSARTTRNKRDSKPAALVVETDLYRSKNLVQRFVKRMEGGGIPLFDHEQMYNRRWGGRVVRSLNRSGRNCLLPASLENRFSSRAERF